jgi:hypothetical protein
MKKLLFLLLGIAMAYPVFAQDLSNTEKKSSSDDYKIKTVFAKHKGDHKIPLGYFFELNAGYTKFGTKDVFLPGINMGVVIDHNWTLGLSGTFVGNPYHLRYPDIYYNEAEAQMRGANLYGGYGGFLFEYTLNPRSAVHVAFPLMIGAGYFSYMDHPYNSDSLTNHNYNNHYWNDHRIDYSVCFVVEPGVRVEFNLVKILRLGVGISYRYSPDFKLVNTSEALINQFNAKISLRLGKF